MLASRLLALTCVGLTLAAGQPRVSLTDDLRVSAFAGSADLWRLNNGSVSVSTDGGANWATVDSLGHDIESFKIDENFPESRAFAIDSKRGRIFQSVDQGRAWTEMLSDASFWDNPEDEANPLASLWFSMQTNPYAREDVVVTLSQCLENEYVRRCNASKNAFISTDGEYFRRATEIAAPKGQLLDNRCRFFGAEAGPRVICQLRLSQQPQGEGYQGLNVKLFYSDDHGETFAALEEFEHRSVMSSMTFGGLDAVTTIEAKKSHQQPAYQLWLSRDGSHYEQAGSPVDHHILTKQNFGGSSERLIVRSISKGEETLLVANINGSLLTPLVAFNGDSQSASFIDTSEDHAAVILHPWIMYGKSESGTHGGDTRISFDGGHEWTNLQLRDPAREFGCDLTQAGNCFVNSVPIEPHLASGVPGLSALVGVAVAVNDTSRIRSNPLTFLTTDGGHSWQKLLDFPAVVAFGNYGNLILAAPTSNGPKTSQFYYSIDQGSSWSTGEFDQPLRVFSLAPISSGGSGAAFTVLATHEMEEFRYIIDFSEMLEDSRSSVAASDMALDFGPGAAFELTAGAQQVLERLNN
ncbi:Type I transmembrane sorting receptor [Lachancea thermotolerans]